MTLPPGQRLVDAFPRFGLPGSAPRIPDNPVIEIRGTVAKPYVVTLAALAMLRRREITADFHCVAGWSFAELRWAGVSFEDFHRTFIEPALLPETPITHVVFGGRDRYRSIVSLEDALRGGVLIAEQLNGRTLDIDHGAPVRVVSPNQYGYISTEHLCLIEVHVSEPPDTFGSGRLAGPLLKRHPRARVWEEERHRHLPAWALSPIYRALTPFIVRRNATGLRRGGTAGPPS